MVEAYERLSQFVQKHLPDPFYLKGDQRISLRDKIFREVIANLLVHREYISAYPAQLIVEPERVVTKNANRAVSHGLIDPQHFSPHPKNPVMLNFFKQLGRADKLGSGIRNVTKYLPHYVPGKTAQFTEGDMFETIVPYPYQPLSATASTSHQPLGDAINEAVSDAVKLRLERELAYIADQGGLSISDLKENFAIERATAQRDMKLLRDAGWITFVGIPKTGKYQLTKQGKQLLQ